MYAADPKTLQRMAPYLQRVLIAEPHAASARLLADLLRSIAPCQIWTAPTEEKAHYAARNVDPQLIFVDKSAALDGLAFTRALRRGDLSCRQAPVIMVASEATAGVILAARDCGVHEFLRKPFTIKDVVRRLEAVTLRPRDWIEGVGYVGPDRRRFNSGDYAGPRKRRSDAAAKPDAARLAQALRILKAAVAAVESDPAQAMRAMTTQCADLQKLGVAAGDLKLCGAAAELQRSLAAAAARPVLEEHLARLWAFMPQSEAA